MGSVQQRLCAAAGGRGGSARGESGRDQGSQGRGWQGVYRRKDLRGLCGRRRECGRLGLRCFQGLKRPTKGKSQVVVQYRTQGRWNVWILAAQETDRAGSKRG